MLCKVALNADWTTVCVLQELLQRLFQLFDQDRDSLLVQEDWVEFLKERLT
jgi:hypothetical protein